MIRVGALASGVAVNLPKQIDCHWHITDSCFNMVFLSVRINILVPQSGADPMSSSDPNDRSYPKFFPRLLSSFLLRNQPSLPVSLPRP